MYFKNLQTLNENYYDLNKVFTQVLDMFKVSMRVFQGLEHNISKVHGE